MLTGCKRTSSALKTLIAVKFPSFLFFKTLSDRNTIKLDIKNNKFTEFKLCPKEIKIPLIAQIVPANKPILEFSFDEIIDCIEDEDDYEEDLEIEFEADFDL